MAKNSMISVMIIIQLLEMDAVLFAKLKVDGLASVEVQLAKVFVTIFYHLPQRLLQMGM